jgi:hypothetical protein
MGSTKRRSMIKICYEFNTYEPCGLPGCLVLQTVPPRVTPGRPWTLLPPLLRLKATHAVTLREHWRAYTGKKYRA